MEKEEKLDSGRVCRQGADRNPMTFASWRSSPQGAASKQRRARRRSHTVLSAFLAAGDYHQGGNDYQQDSFVFELITTVKKPQFDGGTYFFEFN